MRHISLYNGSGLYMFVYYPLKNFLSFSASFSVPQIFRHFCKKCLIFVIYPISMIYIQKNMCVKLLCHVFQWVAWFWSDSNVISRHDSHAFPFCFWCVFDVFLMFLLWVFSCFDYYDVFLTFLKCFIFYTHLYKNHILIIKVT